MWVSSLLHEATVMKLKKVVLTKNGGRRLPHGTWSKIWRGLKVELVLEVLRMCEHDMC